MSTTQPSPEYVVRAVRPDDPDEVDRFYEVCLRTAASGADATSLFADGRLPGDIFVRPYLRYAHDLDWVLARPGQLASGYILGTADTIAFEQTLDQEWWSNSENNSAAGQHRRARRTSEPETGSPTPAPPHPKWHRSIPAISTSTYSPKHRATATAPGSSRLCWKRYAPEEFPASTSTSAKTTPVQLASTNTSASTGSPKTPVLSFSG